MVFVEWMDASRGDDWERLSDIKEDALKCLSVGWLFVDDENKKVILPHIDADKTQGCGRMTIPTSAIIRISDMDPPIKGL